MYLEACISGLAHNFVCQNVPNDAVQSDMCTLHIPVGCKPLPAANQKEALSDIMIYTQTAVYQHVPDAYLDTKDHSTQLTGLQAPTATCYTSCDWPT